MEEVIDTTRKQKKDKYIAILLRHFADKIEQGFVDYEIDPITGFRPDTVISQPIHNTYRSLDTGTLKIGINVEIPSTKQEFSKMVEDIDF